MSKCNKTEDEEEYGPNGDGPPLIDSIFVKQNSLGGGGECPPPPPPPNGTLSCSNPDLVQVTYQISNFVSHGIQDKYTMSPKKELYFQLLSQISFFFWDHIFALFRPCDANEGSTLAY